jgi:hypothetical protein
LGAEQADPGLDATGQLEAVLDDDLVQLSAFK